MTNDPREGPERGNGLGPMERLVPSVRLDVREVAAEVREGVEAILEWLIGPEATGGSGYRAWFRGAPGAGKRLTAALLGEWSGRDVYRIDLSELVDRWESETEQELARLFEAAEEDGWILFFDEADALFGERVESRGANDRAPNQQTAYLLQRIEDFPGLVILATDLKSHLDEAFLRRLRAILDFPLPDPGRRREPWRKDSDPA